MSWALHTLEEERFLVSEQYAIRICASRPLRTTFIQRLREENFLIQRYEEEKFIRQRRPQLLLQRFKRTLPQNGSPLPSADSPRADPQHFRLVQQKHHGVRMEGQQRRTRWNPIANQAGNREECEPMNDE